MKNKELVSRALDILLEMMAPWVCKTVKETVPEYKADTTDSLWWEEAIVPFAASFHADQMQLLKYISWQSRTDSLDIQACCNVIERNWNNIFVHVMNKKARSWNKLVQAARNDISHMGSGDYSKSDTTSALDNIARLAGEIDPDTQEEIQALYRKHVYGNEGGSTVATANAAAPQATSKPVGVMQTTPVTGLHSWRDIIEPHPDVAQGRYKNAEFAADLAQVARGEGAYEYRDPVEFFGRTYVTEGMKGLLTQALRRVGGMDGEPVIQLKTAFGGGKTHSMLALYHLLRGRTALAKLPHIKALVEEAGLEKPPICRVAVLVGTALEPAKSKRPVNLPGTTVNTLWGELAYQLAVDSGNPKLYDYVKDSDKKGVSPGSLALKQLFDDCGPCVILIDELVAYAKKLWKKDDLPAGTFDNLITFVQEITEAARASKNSLVVASIPESNIEIGEEEGGRRALEAIEHSFGRMESIWKPVGANEGFEIVRRRLFLSCKDEAGRDAVCQAFSQFYQDNGNDFPTSTKEVDYLERMRSCYPIHPEIFDRLYEDWATIERFQKTRGVLRLMAAVVHNLWINQDGGLLIMPGSMSFYVPAIRDELTRHVGDNWNPIVEREVDGDQSIPYQKDKEIPRFGRYMAARRIARTVMLGSAPSTRSDKIRGLESSRIRLGAIQPGENIATFNDALNTLQGALSYLYSNPTGDRFWFDTRPTLRKIADDRASQRSNEEVEMEIERRLHQVRKERPFSRLHICPDTSMDVSDDQDVGLVILNTNQVYKSNNEKDIAIQAATDILNTRGLSPRIYRNMLAFIAPDSNMAASLREAVKMYLAWISVQHDSEDLNLDAAQVREAENNVNRWNQTVEARIKETYCHLLVPYIDREIDLKTIIWDELNIRSTGPESIVAKAASKMQQNEQLITQWAPALLTMELEKALWRDANEINVGELWKMLCTYGYLPRLANCDVLLQCIQTGVNSDEYFGYAEGKGDGRYIGLKFNQYVGFIDRSGYLVKPLAALKQKAQEAQAGSGPNLPPQPGPGPMPGPDPYIPPQPGPGPVIDNPPAGPTNTRFSMSTKLDSTRVIKNVSNVMDEVINHLTTINGADVEIRLIVDATIPDGTPQGVVRTVTENCKTLKVEDFGFEE